MVIAVLLAVVATQWSESLRVFEARVASEVVGLFSRSAASGDVVYAGLGGTHPLALRITSTCTSGLLALPCLGAMCFYLLHRGVRLSAALLGLATGVLVVFVLNEARLATMVAGWTEFGGKGLWIAHELIGTVISVVAVLLALGAQLRLSAWNSQPQAREF